LLTADISEEVNALFVGRQIIKLQDIKEAHNFSTLFIIGCAAAFALGSVPIALFSLILRDQHFPLGWMRIVSPALGALIVFRSLLGASVVLKSIFALQYVLDIRTLARQKIGSAFQSQKQFS